MREQKYIQEKKYWLEDPLGGKLKPMKQKIRNSAVLCNYN
jgi:hypothetical protein